MLCICSTYFMPPINERYSSPRRLETECWPLGVTAVKCDLCCKGLIGSVSSGSRLHSSDILTYLKTLGENVLGLKQRWPVPDNLSLSATEQRAGLLLSLTAFLFRNIDLPTSAEQCLHGILFLHGRKNTERLFFLQAV